MHNQLKRLFFLISVWVLSTYSSFALSIFNVEAAPGDTTFTFDVIWGPSFPSTLLLNGGGTFAPPPQNDPDVFGASAVTYAEDLTGPFDDGHLAGFVRIYIEYLDSNTPQGTLAVDSFQVRFPTADRSFTSAIITFASDDLTTQHLDFGGISIEPTPDGFGARMVYSVDPNDLVGGINGSSLPDSGFTAAFLAFTAAFLTILKRQPGRWKTPIVDPGRGLRRPGVRKQTA
jgi:hypothetical protein